MHSTSGTRTFIRVLGLAVLVAMALVPPWQAEYSLDGEKRSVAAGYHLLWQPPSEIEVDEGATGLGYRINVIRLGIQLAAVLIVMNVGLALLKDGAKSPA